MRAANIYLILGGVSSGLAALFHIACIIFGATWYRFFGAGEAMVRLVEQGSWYPAIITFGIALVLSSWSLFAFSGAGLVIKVPFIKVILVLITGIYVLRGLTGFYFVSDPMGRSPEFWIWSSQICLLIGGFHALGLIRIWDNV